MRYYYDLHMHSCLSPCGDNDMTPNNIVNMAILNGLDLLALSDHNSARNLPAVFEVAREHDLLLVPAIEAESAEEVHLLCLLPTLEAALELGEWLEAHLPPVMNRPEIFGDQLILDARDEEIGRVEPLLIQATTLPMDTIRRRVVEMGGVCIAAHIDRTSNSVISNLGFVSEEMGFTTLELSTRADPCIEWPMPYHYLHNSDAHYLWDIQERKWSVELETRSIDALFAKLSKKP